MESTRFEIYIATLGPSVRLPKLRFMAKKCVFFLLSPGPPHFCTFASVAIWHHLALECFAPSYRGAQGSLRLAERPSVGNSDKTCSAKMLIPTSISMLLCQLLNFEKSGFIKWSFWRRTAKRLIPLKSTRFEVPMEPVR